MPWGMGQRGGWAAEALRAENSPASNGRKFVSSERLSLDIWTQQIQAKLPGLIIPYRNGCVQFSVSSNFLISIYDRNKG